MVPKYLSFCHHIEEKSFFVLFTMLYIITAQALQLPLIPPILPEKDSGQFPHGANFAVMGATALGAPLYPGSSLWCLGVQMGWFDEMVYLRATGDGNYYIHQSYTNIFFCQENPIQI